MYLDEKGQMSVDLIFATLVAVIIIGSFISFVSNESHQNQTGNVGQARMQGEKIAEAVNTAYINGPGYRVDLAIPPSPELMATVSNSTHSVTVTCSGQSVTVNLIPASIGDANLTSGSSYSITNNNGTIQIL